MQVPAAAAALRYYVQSTQLADLITAAADRRGETLLGNVTITGNVRER